MLTKIPIKIFFCAQACWVVHGFVIQHASSVHAHTRTWGSAFSLTPPRKYGHCQTHLNAEHNDPDFLDDEVDKSSDVSRRKMLLSTVVATASLGILPDRALAKLAIFPREKFENNYHIMRAGESLLEEEGVYSTNPLFLTSRESALSEKGVKEMEVAAKFLREQTQPVTLVKFSLAAHAIDSSNIIGNRLQLGKDRLLQEFTYMDPRAVGQWDTLPFNEVEPAIWALDYTEAGPQGKGGEPPPTDDSTPNETLAIQVTRLRQLISALDTSFSGENILLIFPDGTGPALLTCMIGGIPLNRVHELNYEPGEVRLNVVQSRALAMLPKEPSESYLEKIEKGKMELQKLRDNPDDIMNMNEKKYEAERKILQDEQDSAAKMKQQQQDLALAQNKAKREKTEQGRKQKQLALNNAKREKDEKQRLALEKAKEVKTTSKTKSGGISAAIDESSFSGAAPVLIAAVGLGIAGVVASEDTPEDTKLTEANLSPKIEPPDLGPVNAANSTSSVDIENEYALASTQQEKEVVDETSINGERGSDEAKDVNVGTKRSATMDIVSATMDIVSSDSKDHETPDKTTVETNIDESINTKIASDSASNSAMREQSAMPTPPASKISPALKNDGLSPANDREDEYNDGADAWLQMLQDVIVEVKEDEVVGDDVNR